jgi:hypothetical protein
MRPPRFRFPEEVRSATRVMASRMVQEGSVAQTPAELEAWIARDADVREPLVHGGYGEAFTAEDLFPLLQASVQKAGGPAPAAAAAPRHAGRRWPVGLLIALVVAVLLLVAVRIALSQPSGEVPPPPTSIGSEPLHHAGALAPWGGSE